MRHDTADAGRFLVHAALGPWLALALLLAPAGGASAGDDGNRAFPNVLSAGSYSFSDELGGFRLLSANGSGTADDPFVLIPELESASPVTMVIRATKPIRPFADPRQFATGFLPIHLEVVNNSALPWVEFGFELQEHLGMASLFGDGLSFDQRITDSKSISSDHFRSFSRNFEPYDRLLFREGDVNHLDTATFRFLITDFTPRWEFFLVMDPRIPAS